MAAVNNYRDLLVWQKAMSLVKEIDSATHTVPSAEIYGPTSQLRRFAVSIPGNIAEGYGRNSKAGYKLFYKWPLARCSNDKRRLK